MKSQAPAEHRMHGATFTSYVAPARGSEQLCAWRVRVDPGVHGQAHRVTHEEVFLVLSGTPSLVVDDEGGRLAAGDVVLAGAGSSVRLDNDGETAAELWVTTSVGLTAQMADGTQVVPPWVR